ncbi:hypothetical protein MMAG44476_08711 [Mycolicibacterium mageritense DSM 44476 = CIP 104973]
MRQQPRLIERTGYRRTSKFGCVLDKGVIRVTEIVEMYIVFDWAHQVPSVHFRAFVQCADSILDTFVTRQTEQRFGHFVLGVTVWR